MVEEEKKRSLWDSLGKIFRGRKDEIPLGCDYCENCGKIVLVEELHHIVSFFGNRQEELILCDDCIENPPSSWKRNFVYRRHSK